MYDKRSSLEEEFGDNCEGVDMRTRTLARMYALQILYKADVTNDRIDSVLNSFWQLMADLNIFRVPEDIHTQAKQYANLLVYGTLENLATINKAIIDCAEHWEIHRMPIIDRCILRLATYELFYLIDVPPAVSINEAIELAKNFSTEESAKFINAILDKVKNLAKEAAQIEDLWTVSG
ncbi:TPA: transcription antitermination factor NusB [Candidatus Poribacteria bacterium]|nr:transcription antitermination factor NusB [Candidatus Poribacteria bacterium]